ncbi:DivIVA domain-containing protein [Streptomyces buecherae]|uniref:DivIVA domain-containing protein n=1 Tax=Streptomyces buecherae TaxID=2763006 RepID=UPI0036BE69BB
MFWFLLIALVAVVGAVTLVVVGGGDGAALPEAQPDRLLDPLPEDRPVDRADIEALRLPLALRGYRMAEVDDALGRLGAELAERDARIAALEAVVAGTEAGAYGGPGLIGDLGAARAGEAPGPGAGGASVVAGGASVVVGGGSGAGSAPPAPVESAPAVADRPDPARDGAAPDESDEPDEPDGGAEPDEEAESAAGGGGEPGRRAAEPGSGRADRGEEEGERA